MSTLPSLASLSPRGESQKGGILFYLIVFLVVAIISYIVLYSWNPEMLQKIENDAVSGKVDTVKVLVISFIVALVVDIIVWLVRRR
jgi:Kef-type K+ transport system membrane component KefB